VVEDFWNSAAASPSLMRSQIGFSTQKSWMQRGPIVSNGRRLPKFVLRRPARHKHAGETSDPANTPQHQKHRDLEAKPLEWQGFYSLRRGITTQLTATTRDPMVAKGLLRHSGPNTALVHYIKDVPEVTANGMARIEQLFSRLDEKASNERSVIRLG
jgi:hypothetical protein